MRLRAMPFCHGYFIPFNFIEKQFSKFTQTKKEGLTDVANPLFSFIILNVYMVPKAGLELSRHNNPNLLI
jgi:hypothetical protein